MGLTTVTRTQVANAALKDGRVRPEGVELDFLEVDPLIKAFRQMVRGREYDVCELAFTTCHLCEAKWWYRDGEAVPLQSVIGLVVQK